MALATQKPTGFTLIEMSIVLVIVGLVVGAIFSGKALIENSRLNNQVQQIKELEVAYNTFVDKYDAIPGDMINASTYWPGALNGDGNRRITGDADWRGLENIVFFSHLTYAALLKHSYNGTPTIEQGYPELKISKGKGMIAAGSIQQGGLDDMQLSDEKGRQLVTAALYINVSRPSDGSSSFNDHLGVLTPAIAQTLDVKLDDGSASSGKLIAYSSYGTQTGNCLTAIGGDYLISNSEMACCMEYMLER